MLKCFGFGRLVRDVVLTEIPSSEGKTTFVARFTIASNENRKSKDKKVQQTSFVECELFDSGAKVLSEYARQGDLLTFSGKLRQNKWVSKTGENKSKIVIRIDEFHITEKKNKDSNQESQVEETVSSGSAPF